MLNRLYRPSTAGLGDWSWWDVSSGRMQPWWINVCCLDQVGWGFSWRKKTSKINVHRCVWLVWWAPEKVIYIYMYLALVLQKKEYATKFRIPNTSDLVNIQLLHPSNLPGFAIFASLAMPYSPNISIYPLNSPRTRIQMMMTPCWGSPGQRHTAFNGGKLNTHARLKRRSLLFVGNHYVHCVFRFHLLIFQGSTSCN